MPFRGLAWAEEGWRRELGVEVRAAAMAGVAAWRDGATHAATASGGRRCARGEREGELERVRERATRQQEVKALGASGAVVNSSTVTTLGKERATCVA